MTYEAFKTIVIKEMGNLFPDAKVECQTVLKNNDEKYDGLIVMKPEECCYPTIYLNEYYKPDITPDDMLDILFEIFQIVETNNATFRVQEILNNFKEFEYIKNQITYVLVNKEFNKERLKDTVYRDFMDMAIIYKIDIDRTASITILNKHIENWGVTEEDLFNAAKENTPKIYPVEVEKMVDIIESTMKKKSEGHFSEFKEVFKLVSGISFEEFVSRYENSGIVVTNNAKHLGAAVCLYDGVLEKLTDKFSENPLIVMSSVNEFLIYERNEKMEKTLFDIVKDTNQSMERTEILSNNVYEYDKESKKLRILK